MSHFLHIPTPISNVPAILSDAVIWLDAGNSNSWESGGATFSDLSGNSNDIAVVGPTYNSGQGGNMIFDGNNDYCDGNINFTMTSGAITLEMWFKPIAVYETDWWNFMNYGSKIGTVTNSGGTRLFYGLRYVGSLDGATTQTYRDSFYQVGNTEEKMANVTITTGTWNHWVSARDNTDIKNYINGTLVGTSTHQFNPTDGKWLDQDLTLGCKDNITAYWNFASTITRMYEKKLTQTNVTDIFNYEKSRHGL